MQNQIKNLQQNAERLTRVNLGLAAVLAVFIIASDAWNLVTRELTSQRWMMCGALLLVTAATWYLSRYNSKNPAYYKVLIVGIILAQVVLASFVVFTERGMASRGVALYALPIVSSLALLSRSAVFAAATLCTAAYAVTATQYFYIHFNEGYKAELYATLFLYSAVFYALAFVLSVVMRPKKSL
ncbi:MAG: hypothetical protein QG553_384 [Patescibacteria group bacterium]|nr:hypothetical protein [Patescibacteria group bacterium]